MKVAKVVFIAFDGLAVRRAHGPPATYLTSERWKLRVLTVNSLRRTI